MSQSKISKKGKKKRQQGTSKPSLQKWERTTLKKLLKDKPEQQKEFTSISSEPIERLYTPEHIRGSHYHKKIGYPGEYPFTRGIHATMYRGRHWTMRQFAGFGTASDTNKRFKYLLEHGQTGLSTAFHFPTIMGYDSDSPRSRGEVGVCGVAIDSLADMEILFHEIPLDQVTVSMTINGPASILLAFFLATAEKQGVPWHKVGGTIQNDILKEYIAQNSYLVPPEPAMRIVVDMIEFCSQKVPRWNPVSISGYHIREAGSTAIQELAFTIGDGIAYVQACIDRGLKVDDFAPRLSYFFNAHMDFFEEIAKFRAARRMWAQIMKERFKAKKQESLKLRFHCQTAGCSLTAQQPENNIVRTTIEAMAGILGGCQSLHTNSMDETMALPTDKAVRTALRTQQILAYESGIINTIDPLAGSYFIEALTNKMEKGALEYIDKIDKMGGMIEALKRGYPQMEIANASHAYQKQIEKQQKIIVGVNKFVVEKETFTDLLKIDTQKIQKLQESNLASLKLKRQALKVKHTLAQLTEVAKTDANIMPALIECARAYCTIGEIAEVLREVFGEYKDPGIY